MIHGKKLIVTIKIINDIHTQEEEQINGDKRFSNNVMVHILF